MQSNDTPHEWAWPPYSFRARGSLQFVIVPRMLKVRGILYVVTVVSAVVTMAKEAPHKRRPLVHAEAAFQRFFHFPTNMQQINYLQGQVVSACGQTYLLHEELGRGANAVVFRAINNATGEAQALKLMQNVQDNAEAQQMIRSERESLTLLRYSPNIIDLYCIEEYREMVVFVMELCSGDLFDAVADYDDEYHPMSFEALVSQLILPEIRKGIAQMRRYNIAHLDLKPENILLCQNHLKLIDFGFARIMVDDLVYDHLPIRGSPKYVAPEILNQTYSAKADLYSTGATLEWLLGGDVSPSGQTSFLPSTTSPAMRALVQSLKQSQAKDRVEFVDFFYFVDELERTRIEVPSELVHQDRRYHSTLSQVILSGL